MHAGQMINLGYKEDSIPRKKKNSELYLDFQTQYLTMYFIVLGFVSFPS